MKIKDAQRLVRDFTDRNNWEDEPNIDKFDHVHEELIEMSRHLRYKNLEERRSTVREKKELFEDGVGDLLFVVLRLANQLGVDAEKAFEDSSRRILEKYEGKGEPRS